jgi:coenzyme F420-reducing hydrogenase beta subunit
MNIENLNQENCCGCSACMSVCPKKAIKMIENNKGFLYPKIEHEKCVECGLCYKVCTIEYENNSLEFAFAAKNRNANILKQSSSGGVSYALCSYMIKKGGVVYGVAYDENHDVITKRADNLQECEGFFGSKYVQTDLKETFQGVYQDLKNEKSVLYFGTSCHIAGLLSYLRLIKCSTDKLITVDLVCHGVPSPKIFKDYINFLKRDKKFSHFEFRTKEKPWGYGSKNYACTIYYTDGDKEIDTLKARIFLNLFFSNNFLRPNCFSCKFASINKPSDITMADYWGLKEAHPEFYDQSGVSAVLIHTQKGIEFLMELDDLELLESSSELIARKQDNLKHASIRPISYNDSWNDYYQGGFMKIAKTRGGYSLTSRIKRKIKDTIRRK